MHKNGTNSSAAPVEEILDGREPDYEELERLFQKAVRRELRIHKALGNPIVTQRDGRIVTVPPDQIQVDDEPAA